MKTTRFIFTLGIGLSTLSPVSYGLVTLTDSTNITLANFATSTVADVFSDPDVTDGNVGDLITYTPSSSENPTWTGGFSGASLHSGNAGPGGPNTGTSYAIADTGPGTITLALTGGSQEVGSIAIYNGYTNRDNATYTLRDDSGTLGAWTITETVGSSHVNADIFWLTFNTPVTTSNLFIDYSNATDFNDTVSFAAIQVYAIPEPSSVVLTLLGFLCLVPFVRSRKRARN